MTSTLSAYQVLERIVVKEITTASFPSHFSIVPRLRAAISDRQAPHRRLVQLMSGEPVVSAKLIEAANKAIYYESEGVKDISRAIEVLGSSSVRRIVLGVAMSQLVASKSLMKYSSLSRSIWLQSLQTAAAAGIIAETMTDIAPDEAFFSGLVMHIGAFYLLYRAAISRQLGEETSDVIQALKHHSFSLTQRVLEFLSIPASVTAATNMTDFKPIHITAAPRSIREILYASTILAMEDYPWYPELTATSSVAPAYHDLRPRINDVAASLHRQYLET